MKRFRIGASRGRWRDGEWRQQLEIGTNISNTITTVTTDNLVIEMNTEELIDKLKAIKAGELDFDNLSKEEMETAFSLGLISIRKLTPRECFRFMDVPEWAIDKMENYPYSLPENEGKEFSPEEKKKLDKQRIAKSNLYKLAGNSIVRACMYHCYRNLFGQEEVVEVELFPGF